MKNCFIILLAFCVLTSISFAEPQRPMLTKENAFPEFGHAEVGGTYQFIELADDDDPLNEANLSIWTGYGRLGVAENLTLNVSVPYVDIDRDFGEEGTGLGDITAGLELRAWQDIFDYPYVIPYLEGTFGTGDEDEGIGLGHDIVTIGTSVGTVTYDRYHWILDARYNVISQRDNIFSVSGTFIWDVGPRFSVLGESRVSNEDVVNRDNSPVFIQGGMVYKATDDFWVSWYAGGGSDSIEEVKATFKAAYSF